MIATLTSGLMWQMRSSGSEFESTSFDNRVSSIYVPFQNRKHYLLNRGYSQIQRTIPYTTLPRFPRLITTVSPEVVMIKRRRPLCSLCSLTKNPTWTVNTASNYSTKQLRKTVNVSFESRNTKHYVLTSAPWFIQYYRFWRTAEIFSLYNYKFNKIIWRFIWLSHATFDLETVMISGNCCTFAKTAVRVLQTAVWHALLVRIQYANLFTSSGAKLSIIMRPIFLILWASQDKRALSCDLQLIWYILNSETLVHRRWL